MLETMENILFKPLLTFHTLVKVLKEPRFEPTITLERIVDFVKFFVFFGVLRFIELEFISDNTGRKGG